jgi:hypothetical protein
MHHIAVEGSSRVADGLATWEAMRSFSSSSSIASSLGVVGGDLVVVGAFQAADDVLGVVGILSS